MVKISKEQAAYIMAHINEVDNKTFGTVNEDGEICKPVTRTMKQKSKRHWYYACNDPSVLKLINDYNAQINVIETYGRID